MSSPCHIRPATPSDIPTLLELIAALAEYERLTHLLQVTPQRLQTHLFGPRPIAEALVAERAPEEGASGPTALGFALFFHNYSTFLGLPGLYLEDLFVRPTERGRGVGKALLSELARVAVARGCGRFEWSVLDWNDAAIRFYERMGATVLPDWRICRLTGPALERLGGQA